jgi:predicted RNase H-like nuclease (RuvC/YqgF family)
MDMTFKQDLSPAEEKRLNRLLKGDPEKLKATVERQFHIIKHLTRLFEEMQEEWQNSSKRVAGYRLLTENADDTIYNLTVRLTDAVEVVKTTMHLLSETQNLAYLQALEESTHLTYTLLNLENLACFGRHTPFDRLLNISHI